MLPLRGGVIQRRLGSILSVEGMFQSGSANIQRPLKIIPRSEGMIADPGGMLQKAAGMTPSPVGMFRKSVGMIPEPGRLFH